jgi:glycosyltransferase involved in cell wall biosynthesis
MAALRSEMSAAPRTRILEVTSYPPPRAGWGVRVQFLKKRLEDLGHECVVLNIGTSRNVPSVEYETVADGLDFIRKVWRFSRGGYLVHAHANGDSLKGLTLALLAEIIACVAGRGCCLTFHAGAIQRYFPPEKHRALVPAFWLLFALPRRIICNSEAVKACITRYRVPPEKIIPIPAFSRQYLEASSSVLPEPVEEFFSRFPTVVFSYVRMRPLFFPMTLLEGMAMVMARRRDVGLLIVGGTGHADEGVWPQFEAAVKHHRLEDRICFVDDLDHDAFLAALRRSSMYLRTPITDGVASSVLEALVLRVPVVASENGTRPPGVVTYPAAEAERMASAVEFVCNNRSTVIANMPVVDVEDTVQREVDLLTTT